MSDFPAPNDSLRVPSTHASSSLPPMHAPLARAGRPASEKVSFVPLEAPGKAALAGRRSSYVGVTVSVEEDVLEEQMRDADLELGRSRSRLSGGGAGGAFDEFPRLD